ncbi:hypothetical protein IV44_GL001304 [Lactobacillus amylovorus DSM 16698]|uniref:Uncharacterized protein n=1 Tax=Lactobacillus amylovorus subsp. animalium DSM 16698 TaxID=695563 RepID=A0A0R2KG24_LACAM|nr:hypothetical protein [Lactobacillus amylovorus]KRN88335.1 hypothetical protein IV44_GL001304 [Lactobacillus amylovorus DSM 16698]
MQNRSLTSRPAHKREPGPEKDQVETVPLLGKPAHQGLCAGQFCRKQDRLGPSHKD